MRTFLLKRLRRKARAKFYIRAKSVLPLGVNYVVCKNEPFIDEFLGSFWDKDIAIKELYRYRREYIEEQIELIRFRIQNNNI